jgi:hypothetical protein
MLGVELGYLGTQNNLKESLSLGRMASTIKTNEGYGDLRGQRRRDGRQGRQRRLLGREHRPGRELSLRRTAPVG